MSRYFFITLAKAGFCLIVCLATLPALAKDLTLPSEADLFVKQIRLIRNTLTSTTTVEVLAGNAGAALGRRQPIVLQFLTGNDEQSAEELETTVLHSTSGGVAERIVREYPDAILNENLFVKVDPFNNVQESNESNNAISASLLSAEIENGNPDLKLDVALNDESFEIMLDSMARFLITLVGYSTPEDNPVAAVLIENDSGIAVHRTGDLPLLLDDLNGGYRGEFYWSTLGLDEGEYSIVTAVKNSNGVQVEHKQFVRLVSLNANHAPVAEPDEAFTRMDQALEIDLLLNDYEPDGDRLEHYISQHPVYGEVTELRGTASYTPAPGFVGIDRFMYQLDDTHGGSDWAQVTVNVFPIETGCTWVRDFASPISGERVAIDGWSDYELPESGIGEYRSNVLANDNPELFEEQPFISFPSCSLYYTAKPGVSGTATVTYVVVDKETKGKLYTSAERQFTLSVQSGETIPEIISLPDTYMEISDIYNYKPQIDVDRSFDLYALSLPDFLEIQRGEVLLAEKPDNDDIGMHEISLVLDFGDISVRQSYWLTLTPDLVAAGDELNDNLVLEDQNSNASNDNASNDNASNDNASVDLENRSGGGALSAWILAVLLIPAAGKRFGRSKAKIT